jgi:ABC-2 type transport system ATP-binding protein
MQQKIQFIAAVIHEPDLLILDEVFSGLDPVNRRLMRELIREQNEAGRTIIFSTHAMFEAEQLCDHLFMINKGVKVLDMALDQVWKSFDPKTVAIEPLDAADASKPWGSLPGVKEVIETDGLIDLRLNDNADVGELMRQAASMARVRRLELKRPSLEDIFIELVGENAATLRHQLRDPASETLQEVARG